MKWWTVIRGAAAHAEAWAKGDRASTAVIAQRLGPGGCGDCPHAETHPIGRAAAFLIRAETGAFPPPETIWCGKPYVGPAPACGCPCAAKASIASEACPLPNPRWVAVTVEAGTI